MNDKKYVYISVFCLQAASLAVIFSVFADYRSTGFQKIYSICISLLFWGGLAAGYILLVLFYSKNRKEKQKGLPGILKFFSNRYAAAADTGFFICILLLVIFSLIKFEQAWVYSVLLGGLFFSFHMHCILNGKTAVLYFKKRGNEK